VIKNRSTLITTGVTQLRLGSKMVEEKRAVMGTVTAVWNSHHRTRLFLQHSSRLYMYVYLEERQHGRDTSDIMFTNW